MKISGILCSLLLASGAGLALTSGVPHATAQTQIAQGSEQKDYLPPWERQGGARPEPEETAPEPDYDAPRRIIPPPRERAEDYGDRSYGRRYDRERRDDDYVGAPPPEDEPRYAEDDRTYSSSEIIDAGHRFFGTVSGGLAKVIEHAFAEQGRPNGYILGEEAGGAFVAGLRYGEGVLYTKDAGRHKVYWQGPSLGYDFGAEGSKTMILVYNLHDIDDIYHRFAGIDGSAYLVGGVGITFQTHGDVVLAPIRAGVGVRLGANVGYLKYTREPTWNPF